MFHGSMVALVTPMHSDGTLDFEALDRLIEFHVNNGTDALVAVGTTGESATLSTQEHCQVIRHVVQRANNRVPVMAGTGSNSTAEAIELSLAALNAGADACLLVTPYYNKPTQRGLFEHFRKIAQEVPMPHVLYNVPGRTACDMLPETVEALAQIPNIVGIKEASGKIERFKELIARCGSRLDIISGDDGIVIEVMELGAKGVISVTANVAPRAMHELCKAALNGDFAAARRINAPLEELHQAMFLESNPIPVKWALAQMGLIKSGIRLPLTVLADTYYEPLRKAMKQAEIL